MPKNQLSCKSASAGGYRYPIGSFDTIECVGVWWSFSENSTPYDWNRSMGCNSCNINRNYNNSGRSGFSVRCL